MRRHAISFYYPRVNDAWIEPDPRADGDLDHLITAHLKGVVMDTKVVGSEDLKK